VAEIICGEDSRRSQERRRLRIPLAIIVFGALAITTLPAFAEKRVALVIGDDAYRSVAALPNPARDVSAMAELFRKAGFN